MAIANIQVINVGLPNESTGSDSLYTAFNKVKTNFTNLFENASQYTNFVAGNGISLTDSPSTGTLTIKNSGVTSIIAGTNITTASYPNGAVQISSTGGNGNGGGVTSVGITPVSTGRLTVTNSPVISAGNITLDLATTGVTPGAYTYPSVTVDAYGRITTISSASAAGTVSSVGVIPGDGIQVTGSPVTTTGNINITNTGVTRLNAGTGISLSGSNGNVTISTSVTGGTVTSVNVVSNALVITGSPITTAGTISVDLPANITATGNVLATNGIGYTSGAGGTVTQATSRTTGVTINKASGAITLVSAAGSASYNSFTVTNSTVAATDVVIVNQKSGTDKYITTVSNVAAGSFQITFATTGGTTTEQPVFNFAVIKAVTA